MRHLSIPASALALCALAGCGSRGAQPAVEDPRLGESQQRVESLEKAVGNLQGQPKQPVKLSAEDRLIGNWTPKQAGSKAWLVGLRLESDRTCRFVLHQPEGTGEALKGRYTLVGQQLVIDTEPMGKQAHQWEVRSLSERSVVLRRRGEGGVWEEVRLQRE